MVFFFSFDGALMICMLLNKLIPGKQNVLFKKVLYLRKVEAQVDSAKSPLHIQSKVKFESQFSALCKKVHQK